MERERVKVLPDAADAAVVCFVCTSLLHQSFRSEELHSFPRFFTLHLLLRLDLRRADSMID